MNATPYNFDQSKICLAICYSPGPNSSKFGPSCPQVGPNFLHLAKEMATTFLKPEQTLGNCAVLKKLQSMAIIRILKINNSWPELFNFQNSFNCH